MATNTAKMHERLELQQQTVQPGTYDYPESGWTTVLIIKGAIVKNKGMLSDETWGEFYKDMIWIYCRYNAMPQKGMRVLYNGKTYTINWLEIGPSIPKNLTIGLQLVS